jgi:hypothetical protein
MNISHKKKHNFNENSDINSNDSSASLLEKDIVLNKLNILLFNNGWNDKNEKLIIGIGYNSDIYKKLHKKTASFYKKINKGINLSILILSIFLTTDSIINLLQANVLLIVQKLVLFIVTIISIVNSFLKYGELSEQHLQAANSFSIIYNDIRNLMCIYRKDRMNAVKYIQKIIKEYDYLEISSPEIPSRYIKEMENTIKKDNITGISINKFREIEVVINNDDKDNDNISNNSKNKFKINNMQNLGEIHECFKIDGELSENDHITQTDIENYKKNTIDLQTQYEFNRIMRH